MTRPHAASSLRSALTARPLLVYSLLGAAALVLAFSDAIAGIAESWRHDEYSHGWLIPLLAACLIVNRLPATAQGAISPEPGEPGRRTGILPTAGGLALLALGTLAAVPTLTQYGLLLAIAGLFRAALDTRTMRALAGPLLYLGFAIPLPQWIQSGLSLQMQLLSSEIGVALMRLMDIAVYLEGNIIDLGVYKLEVAEACNGLRYLFPLASFGYLGALLLQDALWKRVTLFLSTIPIAIAMNALRIAVTGLLVEHYGTAMAEGLLHLFEGWVIFILCIAILLVEIGLLLRIGGSGNFVPLHAIVPTPARLTSLGRHPAPPGFKVAVLLVLVSAAVPMSGMRAEQVPEHVALATFPLNLSEWNGTAEALDSHSLEVLKLRDYALANYRRKGEPGFINFYVAYYSSQRTGSSVHSPQSCIPGGGWRIDDLRSIAFDLHETAVSAPVFVNRVLIRRGEARQIVYYWFQQRGRIILDEYMVKLYILWDALTRRRTDGALIRLATPVLPGEDDATAEQRLKNFLRAAQPKITRYIPR